MQRGYPRMEDDMATHISGWTLFPRAKPKPPKAAVSPAVRDALDKVFEGRVEPSEKLREDYRRYMDIKRRKAA